MKSTLRDFAADLHYVYINQPAWLRRRQAYVLLMLLSLSSMSPLSGLQLVDVSQRELLR